MSGVFNVLATISAAIALLAGGMFAAGMTELARSQNRRSLDVLACLLMIGLIASVIVIVRAWSGHDNGLGWVPLVPAVLVAVSIPLQTGSVSDQAGSTGRRIATELGIALLFALPALFLALADGMR